MVIWRYPNNNPKHKFHNRILAELADMLAKKYDILALAHVRNPQGRNLVPIVVDGEERDLIFRKNKRMVLLRVDTRKLPGKLRGMVRRNPHRDK